MNQVQGSSRVLAIIGDPVAHSLSPVMHNAAITALGFDAVYVALKTPAAALHHVLSACEAVGIAGNITIPHKLEITNLLIRITSLAKELGCVNTVWPEDGRLVGDNTDVGGVRDVAKELRCDGPWLVAGTGGAARSVVAAARDEGVPVLITSRSTKKALDLAAWGKELGADARADDGTPVLTAINATPLGMNDGEPLPIPTERLKDCRNVIDLVYRKGNTDWVNQCSKMGITAVDGRALLVAQGVRSFERFFPGAKAPREIMKAAVELHLM